MPSKRRADAYSNAGANTGANGSAHPNSNGSPQCGGAEQVGTPSSARRRSKQWPVDVWDQHLDYARRLTGQGGFVLELIRADDLDVGKWQRFLDGVSAKGLWPVLRLATWQDQQCGCWVAPRKDSEQVRYREAAAEWAQFVGALRWSDQLYVVVGNEPNRGDEWGGHPDPAEYARFLIDVSGALHQVAPGRIRVLNSGLDLYAPDTGGEEVNGFRAYDVGDFLDGMQASAPEVWSALDLWASHAYPLGPFASPPGDRKFQVDDLLAGGPRTQNPPWPGLYNRGLNAYEWELFKLRSFGLLKPLQVVITETGWRHSESQSDSADKHGAVNDGRKVASYLQMAFGGDSAASSFERSWTPWERDPNVLAAIVFAAGGDPSRWGHTNLYKVGPRGEVLGFQTGFDRLVKP